MSFDFDSRCCSSGGGLESVRTLTAYKGTRIIVQGQRQGQREYTIAEATYVANTSLYLHGTREYSRVTRSFAAFSSKSWERASSNDFHIRKWELVNCVRDAVKRGNS